MNTIEGFIETVKNSNEDITSSMYIRQFPFYPKTFIIDVVELENNEFKIKDRSQLNDVFDIYEQ